MLAVLKGSLKKKKQQKNIQKQSEESGSELMRGRRECIILSAPINIQKMKISE